MAQNVPSYRLAYAVLEARNGSWVVVETQIMLKEHYKRNSEPHPP
ncbi:hypothetical protein [Pseudomonas syringae]|nr:hypothetical protein [Pseudomonas syringae]